jgi:hypothetical protein
LEPTIYRLRRFGALKRTFRIISKGPAVIKRLLTVVAAALLLVVLTVAAGGAVSTVEDPGTADDPNGGCAVCW